MLRGGAVEFIEEQLSNNPRTKTTRKKSIRIKQKETWMRIKEQKKKDPIGNEDRVFKMKGNLRRRKKEEEKLNKWPKNKQDEKDDMMKSRIESLKT